MKTLASLCRTRGDVPRGFSTTLMTLSVRRGYRKMQPIFFSFASGLHYRKTVKLYFRRIATFDLVVSICENTLFQRFSSFLTAGNKSYCGTLQRLTGSQQSTDKPIFRPVSPPKRQAMQGKSFVLSPISTQTSSHLRTHRTFDPPRGRRGSYRAIRMWLRRPWAAAP